MPRQHSKCWSGVELLLQKAVVAPIVDDRGGKALGGCLPPHADGRTRMSLNKALCVALLVTAGITCASEGRRRTTVPRSASTTTTLDAPDAVDATHALDIALRRLAEPLGREAFRAAVFWDDSRLEWNVVVRGHSGFLLVHVSDSGDVTSFVGRNRVTGEQWKLPGSAGASAVALLARWSGVSANAAASRP